MTDTALSLIREYCENAAEDMWRSDYPGINAVEQLLRSPGRSLGTSGHRVLYFHRNKRLAKVSKAMHQIDTWSQVALIVKYGRIVMEDGNIMNGKDFVSGSSFNYDEYDAMWRAAVKKLRELLNE